MRAFLIIETQHYGHYLTGYIKYILRAIPKNKFKIVLLTTKGAKKYGKGALDILKKENDRFSIEVIEDIETIYYSSLFLLFYQIRLYFRLKKKFKELEKKYDFFHVFVNSFQHFDKVFSILGSPFSQVKFSGVFLGVKFHFKKFYFDAFSRYNFFSKLLFKILLSKKKLTSLITNDELLLRFIKKENWKNLKKVNFLHDPKEFNFRFNKLHARNELDLPKKSFLILVYGAIIKSKGVEELLSIFKEKDINPNIRVIIAGEIIEDMKIYFKSLQIKKLIKNKKIFIYSDWQDELKESLLFSASDAIWIGYKNYPYPSGVLYQAVAKSLPIITSNEGIISWTNKKYKLGFIVNLKSCSDLISKLNMLTDKKKYNKFKKNIKKFSKIANPSNWIYSFSEKNKFFFE
jgi:hypothetical protein